MRAGRGAEVSTAVGLSQLTPIGAQAFITDDAELATAESHLGWLRVRGVLVGERAFIGNGAVLLGGTTAGAESLVGLLTVAPAEVSAGSSWFGSPALELPRVPDHADRARTFFPSRRIRLARALVDLVRITVPLSLAAALGGGVLWLLGEAQARAGLTGLALALVPVLCLAGAVAAAVTAAVKWVLIGRYRAGTHPFFSSFVWRDELVNSTQEMLAVPWLLTTAQGTPLLPSYLRLMGAHVGRDVHIETLAVTEFDMVTLGDGAVVNRNAVVETHLFHDRLLRIGSAHLGAGASLGPAAATLPDTVIGAGTAVGARSVVLSGEKLPPGTRWLGAPVSPCA